MTARERVECVLIAMLLEHPRSLDRLGPGVVASVRTAAVVLTDEMRAAVEFDRIAIRAEGAHPGDYAARAPALWSKREQLRRAEDASRVHVVRVELPRPALRVIRGGLDPRGMDFAPEAGCDPEVA